MNANFNLKRVQNGYILDITKAYDSRTVPAPCAPTRREGNGSTERVFLTMKEVMTFIEGYFSE